MPNLGEQVRDHARSLRSIATQIEDEFHQGVADRLEPELERIHAWFRSHTTPPATPVSEAPATSQTSTETSPEPSPPPAAPPSPPASQEPDGQAKSVDEGPAGT